MSYSCLPIPPSVLLFLLLVTFVTRLYNMVRPVFGLLIEICLVLLDVSKSAPYLYLCVDRISLQAIRNAPLLARQSDQFQIQNQHCTSTCARTRSVCGQSATHLCLLIDRIRFKFKINTSTCSSIKSVTPHLYLCVSRISLKFKRRLYNVARAALRRVALLFLEIDQKLVEYPLLLCGELHLS